MMCFALYLFWGSFPTAPPQRVPNKNLKALKVSKIQKPPRVDAEWQYSSGRHPNRGNVADPYGHLIPKDRKHEPDPGSVQMFYVGLAVLKGATEQLYPVTGLQGFHQDLLSFPPFQIGADHGNLRLAHYGRGALPEKVSEYSWVAEYPVPFRIGQADKDVRGEIRDTDLLPAVTPLADFGIGWGEGLNPQPPQFLGYL